MKIGVHLPQYGDRLATEPMRCADLIAAAQHAEQLGLSDVWVSDHVALGADASPFATILDATVALSLAAGATTTIGLEFSVWVLPYRPLTITAKTFATLGVLSGGRLIAGIGAGNRPLESAAVGASYAVRGIMTEDHLRELPRALAGAPLPIGDVRLPWTSAAPRISPTPTRAVPVWVGGMSGAARRRAITYGQGWHASFSPAGSTRRYWPDQLAPLVTDMRARTAGRPFTISIRINNEFFDTAPQTPEAALQEYRELGVDHVVYSSGPWLGSIDRWRRDLDRRLAALDSVR